jgi:nicotinate-nucleotide adenylyltransferase
MVVMTRPGAGLPGSGVLAEFVERHRTGDSAMLASRPAGHVLFQPVSLLEISATQIRQLLSAGDSVRFLLPDAVREIIQTERLYRGHDT